MDFAECKPVLCEAEAFSRATFFAKMIGTPILVVHTTNKIALDIAREAHKNEYPIYVETCPHYLTLFKDQYEKKDGHLAICSPPLRTKKEYSEKFRVLTITNNNYLASLAKVSLAAT